MRRVVKSTFQEKNWPPLAKTWRALTYATLHSSRCGDQGLSGSVCLLEERDAATIAKDHVLPKAGPQVADASRVIERASPMRTGAMSILGLLLVVACTTSGASP